MLVRVAEVAKGKEKGEGEEGTVSWSDNLVLLCIIFEKWKKSSHHGE